MQKIIFLENYQCTSLLAHITHKHLLHQLGTSGTWMQNIKNVLILLLEIFESNNKTFKVLSFDWYHWLSEQGG